MKIGSLLQDPKYIDKFVVQKLLCLFLWCTKEELWIDVDKELDDDMVQKFVLAYDDYAVKKKPLEYVLGHVDFFWNEFIVNEATLIPRPETEYMITAVSEFIRWTLNVEHWTWVLLDIWTGCGVLGISVLLQNPNFFTEAIFTDYFADALGVAKQNYNRHIGNKWLMNNDKWIMKVEFLEADLLDFINEEKLETWKTSNIILVANLPYIPEDAFEQNAGDNVKKREPKPAFVAGEDGLFYYRVMFQQLLQLIENWKLKTENLTMFLEMMTWQVDVLRQEFDDRLEFEEVKTFHFNIRIVKAWLK